MLVGRPCGEHKPVSGLSESRKEPRLCSARLIPFPAYVFSNQETGVQWARPRRSGKFLRCASEPSVSNSAHSNRSSYTLFRHSEVLPLLRGRHACPIKALLPYSICTRKDRLLVARTEQPDAAALLGGASLTERQRQVLDLRSQGLPCGAVCKHLQISGERVRQIEAVPERSPSDVGRDLLTATGGKPRQRLRVIAAFRSDQG